VRNSRSCVVEVVNRSELTLRRCAAAAEHGEFTRVPALSIPPGTSDTFTLASRTGNAGMGCGGSVEYVADDGVRFTIRFDKPFAGTNSAFAELAGHAPPLYDSVAATDSDEATLRCRFTLKRRER
jgi:hypothetical protein